MALKGKLKLQQLKKTMDSRLKEFKKERYALKMLKLEEDKDHEKTLYILKREVLDMADKFDDMHMLINKQ